MSGELNIMPGAFIPSPLSAHCEQCKYLTPVSERSCVHCGVMYTENEFLIRKEQAERSKRESDIKSIMLGLCIGVVMVVTFVFFS